MKDEVFDALALWGKLGHRSSIHYGTVWKNANSLFGWACTIYPWEQGSLSIGCFDPSPFGFHPTDIREAVRAALIQVAQRWPETAARAQP